MDKRLYRSRSDRMIGGVAGGLAAYLNIDPLFIRLGFVLLSLANGFGVLIYLLLWLFVPIEGSLAGDPRSQMQENVEDMRTTAEGLVDRVRDAFSGNRQN